MLSFFQRFCPSFTWTKYLLWLFLSGLCQVDSMFLAVIFMVLLQFAVISFPADVRWIDTFDHGITFVWRLVLVLEILSSAVFSAFADIFVFFNVNFCLSLDFEIVIKLDVEARTFNFNGDWFFFWCLNHFLWIFVNTDVFSCCIWVINTWSFLFISLSMRSCSFYTIFASIEANCFMLFHCISFTSNRWNRLDEPYHCWSTIWIKASIITHAHFYIS